jgi:hypothetical protein
VPTGPTGPTGTPATGCRAGVDPVPGGTRFAYGHNVSLRAEPGYQALTLAQPYPGGAPQSYVLLRTDHVWLVGRDSRLTEGSPGDLITEGRIGAVFDTDDLAFDPATATFVLTRR